MRKKLFTKSMALFISALALNMAVPASVSYVKAADVDSTDAIVQAQLNAISVKVKKDEAASKKLTVDVTNAKTITDLKYTIVENEAALSNTESAPVWKDVDNDNMEISIPDDLDGVLTLADKDVNKYLFFKSDAKSKVFSKGFHIQQHAKLMESDYTIAEDKSKIEINSDGWEWYNTSESNWREITFSGGKAPLTTEMDKDTEDSKSFKIRKKATDTMLASEPVDVTVTTAKDNELKAKLDAITIKVGAETATDRDAKNKLNVDITKAKDVTEIQYNIGKDVATLVSGSWTDLSGTNVGSNDFVGEIAEITSASLGEKIFFRKKTKANVISNGLDLLKHTEITEAEYKISADGSKVIFSSKGIEYYDINSWKDVPENGEVATKVTGDAAGKVEARRKANEVKFASTIKVIDVPKTKPAEADISRATLKVVGADTLVVEGLDNLYDGKKLALKYKFGKDADADADDTYKTFFDEGTTNPGNVSAKEIRVLSDKNKLHIKIGEVSSTKTLEFGKQADIPDTVRQEGDKIVGLNPALTYEASWNDTGLWNVITVEDTNKSAVNTNDGVFRVYANGQYKLRVKAKDTKLASDVVTITVTKLSKINTAVVHNKIVPVKEDPKKEDPKKEDPKKDDTKTEAPKTEEPKTETPSTETPSVEAPVNKTVSSKKAAATVSAEDVALVTGKLTVKVKGATVALPKAVLSDGAVKVSLKAMAPKKDSKDAKALTKNLKKNKLVDKNVYSLSVKSGKKNVKGKFTVTLKTTLNKAPKKLYVMNVANGKLMKAKFKKGMVTFTAGMTGKFVVVSK